MSSMQVHSKNKSKSRYWKVVVPVFFIAILAGGTANYMRPLPAVTYTAESLAPTPAQATQLAWPGYGQAAIATKEQGVLATNGAQVPLATASIAKVITALCVLQKYPLQPGQTGPTITLTDADVAIYNNYVANDGSVVPVRAGEQLNQYQLLEAIMLPSANNLADSAAIWAYGSLENYATYANKYLAMNGLTQVHAGTDASGLDPSSAGSASDLARLGLLALEEPLLVEIMSKTQTTLPIAGTVRNYNSLLGANGVFGIKTGNNDQNLGALLFAAKVPVGSSSVNVTGTVMGASSLSAAIASSGALVASVGSNFSEATPVKKGQKLATYVTSWGVTADAVAAKDIRIVRWNGDDIQTKTTLSSVTPGKNTTKVGSVRVYSGAVSSDATLNLNRALTSPSFWWRLTRH